MVGDTITYIIETIDKEYYCGKTKNLDKRIIQHKNEKYPHWFSFKNRKNFKVIFIFKFDVEKNIKRFGIEKFIQCLRP